MSSSASTHPFTCNSCQVAFKSSELQRTHMQTDWHRYNLKRRVASLPPLSSEIFAEKVLASKADAAATAARASFERACEACGKTYFSENAFNNHVGSAKHKQNVARLSRAGQSVENDARSVMSSTFSLRESNAHENDAEDESAEEEFGKVIERIKSVDVKDDANDPIARRPSRPHHDSSSRTSEQTKQSAAGTETNSEAPNEDPKVVAKRECLYCNNYATDLDANVAHMTKEHGLFIPEREYLADLEGLIVFLNRKVHFHYQCTSCNRLKWSEDGIKAHMRDLGHCKIAYETEDEQLEIGKFYDFRSTYSDGDEDWESGSDDDEDEARPTRSSKLGAKRSSIHGSDNDDGGENGEGWETDSSASSVPTEELGRVYLDDDRNKDAKYGKLKTHRHHARTSTSQHHRSADGYHSHAHKPTNAVYHDEFEMHLPTGRIAGHRQFNKYYRQNLRTIPTAEERAQRLLTAAGEQDDGEDEPARGRAADRELVSRANGGLGMLHVSDAKKREVKAIEKKQQRNEGRALRKAQWRVNRNANHQEHFRDHLLQ